MHLKRLLWPDGYRLCRQGREDCLDLAGEFLRSRGLLPDGQAPVELGAKWAGYVRELFQAEHPERFYASWQGEAGAANIVANILDQFSRIYIMADLHRRFLRPSAPPRVILDFGCGTGAMSLTFQQLGRPHPTVLLADVPNLARDFTRFIREQQTDRSIELVDPDLTAVTDHSVDLLFCVHVLEHLPNPSEIFARVESRLQEGGWLYLEAPWGGHVEHLPEARENWLDHGGATILRTRYQFRGALNPLIRWRGGLSGLYRKVSPRPPRAAVPGP